MNNRQQMKELHHQIVKEKYGIENFDVEPVKTVPCPVCGGSGFERPGTGYNDVCSECGGQEEVPEWMVRKPLKRNKVKVKYTPAYQTHDSAGDEAEPYCPKCDADLSYDEYSYCPWCGSELDWEPEPKKKGNEIPVDDEIPFYSAHEDCVMTIEELINFLREEPDHCWTRESELRMANEVERLRDENEYLGKLWNIAYDYGVRVEIDAVTGEIYSHELTKNNIRRDG